MVELVMSTIAGVAVGAVITLMFLRRNRQPNLDATDELQLVAQADRAREINDIASALRGGESIYLPTGAPDEYIVYSSRSENDQGIALPSDLAQTAAAGVSSLLRSAVEVAKASGRLVMVDGPTAKAIKKGTLATDKSGKSLAMVKGVGGKFEHVARLSPAAGKAAGAALGAANVMGAVSTQMQMASIEAKLSAIVDGVRTLEVVARQELDSSILATRQLLAEVVGASREAGYLPAESWAQIAPHYKSIIQDQQMAIGAVENLIDKARDDPKGFWLRSRANTIQTNRELLEERLHALKEADLNAIRMHMVRLWHYTVTQPELAAYFENLARQEVVSQGRVETRLLESARESLSQHGELDRIERTFHWRKSDDYRRQVDEFSRLSPLPGREGPGSLAPARIVSDSDAVGMVPTPREST